MKRTTDGHEGNQGQKPTKEKMRKKLKFYKRKKLNGKREKKIVVTLQYIIAALD